jgi:heptosyltransferase-2
MFLEVAIAAGAKPRSRTPFFSLDASDRAWAEAFFGAEAGLPARDPARLKVVAIHPGGSKAPRAWSASRYAELAARLFKDEGLRPMVVGDTGDAAAGAEIAAAVPGTILSAGRTTVRRMAALMERCALFVGNDSGPMHIAGALGTPSVGIFGPGTPGKTAPRGEDLRFEAVTLQFPCSPCRQDFFKECEPSPAGKPFCLENLTVEMVAAACRRVLRAAPRVSSAPPSSL